MTQKSARKTSRKSQCQVKLNTLDIFITSSKLEYMQLMVLFSLMWTRKDLLSLTVIRWHGNWNDKHVALLSLLLITCNLGFPMSPVPECPIEFYLFFSYCEQSQTLINSDGIFFALAYSLGLYLRSLQKLSQNCQLKV